MRRRPDIDALDLVLGEASEETIARLRDDARLRAEVERLAPVVARLERQPADAWDPPEPPPLTVGVPVPGRRARRRPMAFVLRPSIAIAASLGFVAAGFGLGSVLRDDGPGGPGGSPVAGRVALTALPGHFGRAELVTTGEGRVRIDARGLAPDTGGHHELWLLPADGKGDPVPVGTFRVGEDGRATASYDLPADPARYQLFDVSEEPDDGDPKHSGRSILRAPVVAN